MMLSSRFRGERSEAGETLIEVIIASALMAFAVVALVAGLATTVLGSHVHREQADGNSVLVSAIERIKSADFDYSNVDCSKTDSSRKGAYVTTAAATTLPPTWPATPPAPLSSYFKVTSVKFENVSLVGGVSTVSFTDTCVAGLNRQLVTMSVTSPDGRVVPALSFVKGDV